MEDNLTNITGVKRPASSCTFWLEKKKRFCKTPPEGGLTLCSSHICRSNASELSNTVLGNESKSEDDTKKEITVDSDKSQSQTDAESSSQNGTNNEDKMKPHPDRCHFWMERKRRFCRSRIIGDDKFCVEHSSDKNPSRKRIPCPNDPKHSCYEDKLLHHLNRCNAREKLLPEFYMGGINSGAGTCEDADKVGIRDVSVEEVFRIINVVKKLEQGLPASKSSVMSHAVVEKDINKPTNGVEARRHLVQQASLVGNMQAQGFLRENSHYIEFGAGKGGLSHWIQLANKESSNCQYLLIDKSSVRYKMDNYHKGEEQGPSFERLKIDIENLDLARVPSLKKKLFSERSIICVGKHLCGAATDLMLNCIASKKDFESSPDSNDLQNTADLAEGPAQNQTASRDESVFRRVEGIVLALCCHHRCTWKSYVGRSWFIGNGLSARDFYLIVSMSAWATCGSKHISDESTAADDDSAASYNHPRYGNLLPEEREKIGISCKRVLDEGRIHFLSSLGYEAKLIVYANRENTLENLALVAKPLNNSGSTNATNSISL